MIKSFPILLVEAPRYTSSASSLGFRQDNATNYIRWPKFQILLYRLDGEYGHILDPNKSAVIAE